MDVDVPSQVRAFVREHAPALHGAAVALAASGGADSAAMVSLLCDAGLIDRERSVIGHFDHRLRGDTASRADLDAVRALGERYGLPVMHAAWDAPRPSEEAARVARYRFLGELAERHKCAAVVTGHTADDQAETIVMRIARGSGLHGLRGISPDAPWPLAGSDLRVWRPLLCVDRAATRAWCADDAIAYHDDATNSDRARLRNAVRLDVLPALERAQPGTRAALLRLAEEARPAVERLERAALRAVIVWDDDGAVLDRAALGEMGDDEAACAFRMAVAHVLGEARGFERRHFDLMRRAVTSHAGVTLDLPRGVVLTVDATAVIITAGEPLVPTIDHEFSAQLPFAGRVGAWQIEVMPGGPLVLAQDAVLRRRRPGDRLRRPGLGTKKLQDELVDRHVPRRLRDAVPVIATGSDVLWTPFGRCAPYAGPGRAYSIAASPADEYTGLTWPPLVR